MTENQEKEAKVNPFSHPSNTIAEISTEMKRAYLDYAMTVIVSRALPDIRDGLKPVHRRILFAMYKLGLTSNVKFSKCAKIVGDVLGKYHPHGDSSVYEALVRLAQDFSMRYPLVKGQGNFGSIDGDPAAAMRYTEAKLAKISDEMLIDIDKETVDFTENFDGSLQEPLYLPARLPNLLLMGAEGIAVGMATKIPPHNLGELCNAIICLLDKAEKSSELTGNSKNDASLLSFNATLDDLLAHVKGPDFPTYGIAYGKSDIREMYITGRGKIMMRGVVKEEEIGKKTAIVVTELPYQVNKATLVEKIADLVIDKRVVGISDLRDESNREGIRIVMELKRDASYSQVLNNLYKYTDLQTTFPANIVALVDGIPQLASLQTILNYYIKHRVDIIVKRSEYELKEAKKRAHILEGYLIALDNIDEVIKIIKTSPDEATAKSRLMTSFGLSEIQSQAILEMQLRRLTGLERSKIEEELRMLHETIARLEAILSDVFKVLSIIREDVLFLKEKYADKRRTVIMPTRPGEIAEEELIEEKDVIVVLTKEGYIKHVPKDTFKMQNRGGKGVSGMETRENDNVFAVLSASTHDYLMFFTNTGRVFQNRVWDIPQGTRTSKGKAIVNILNLQANEKVTSLLRFDPTEEIPDSSFILMATAFGTVKKTSFKEFSNIKNNGLIAIKLEKEDELILSKVTDGKMNVILTSKNGKTIVFNEEEVRHTGRASMGVRGMLLGDEDSIISADVFTNEEFEKYLIIISEKGIGKRCQLKQMNGQHRGGKGVRIAPIDKKTGTIAFVAIIQNEEDELMITSQMGQVVRMSSKDIPSYSRDAKGVILMRFSESDDKVVSATFL